MIKLNRRAIGALGAVAAVAVVSTYWFWPRAETASVPAAEAAVKADAELPAVSVAHVRSTKLAPQVSYPGTVMSRNDSRLAADFEGRVEWAAEVGTVVKKGDVVARLDSHMAAMQLESDKANVARLTAVVQFDRGNTTRLQELLERKFVSKAAADQAVSTRDSNEAALKQAQAALKRSTYQLEHAEIRAPFDGRVVARLINAGEYASAGKDVVRLVDLSQIEISTRIPIASMQFLKEGAHVTAEVQGKPVDTTVRVIVPVGDDQSRTVEVRLSLAAEAAFVGDAAKVMIPSAEPRMVLAVPRDALVLREENTYLFKLGKDDKAERIAVEIGAKDGDMVEVLGTLREGERVIIRGAERLETGQKVRLVS